MENDLLRLIQNCEIENVVEGEDTNINTTRFSFLDFVQKITTATTTGEVGRICAAVCHHYGFDFFAVFTRLHRLDATPLCFFMREYEDGWTQHYDNNKYMFTDPNIRLATARVTPFIWSSHLFENITHLLRPHEFKISYDALDFGLRDIFNAPFQNINGDYGLIRFINKANGQSTESERKIRQLKVSELHYLSSYIYEALWSILRNRESKDPLTTREKDVLSWTASGMSPVNIGDRLHISENTVCKHLSNIRRKLGVKNTTHAVAKAISTKIIYH